MNRLILGILTIIFPMHLMGQMFPVSDHYLTNMLSINPAFAGCDNALSASIFYRNQWVGFNDSPKTQVFSVHAPVHNDKIGLGLLIENNSIGIFTETNIMGNYAYRTELYNGKLALGLGFGFSSIHNAWNDLDATDPNDEQLLNNSESMVLPSFSLGAYYYTRKYFFGISLPLFISHESDPKAGKYKIKNDFSEYNYFFTGGYEIPINDLFRLLPSLVIKYHPNHSIQVDYNAQVSFKDKFRVGMGYRSRNILIGMLQCQLNSQLGLAYSYDFDFGKAGKYMNGSHEVGLKYVFNYIRNVSGPRQF